jgi:hypothetical protein
MSLILAPMFQSPCLASWGWRHQPSPPQTIEELFGWINSRAWQAPTRLQPTTNCPRQCAVGRLGNAPVSKILDPDSDQVAKMSCAFRKTVQRVTGDEFDGKSFRLADEVRHIQRRAARHDGRVVSVGQLVLFSTENRRCLAARPFRSARRAVCG